MEVGDLLPYGIWGLAGVTCLTVMAVGAKELALGGFEAERRVAFSFFGVVRGLSSFVMHGAESSLSVYKCAYHDLFIAQMCRAESYTYDPRG